MKTIKRFFQAKTLLAVLLCFLAIVGAAYVLTREASTKTSTVNTYGMSEYTDPMYHFSFWYPSALQITATATNDETEFPGGTAAESLQIGSMGGTSIVVVDSTTSTITDEPAGHASPIAQTKYFYDASSRQWMVAFPEGSGDGSPRATTTADVSKSTISGLVEMPSGRRFDTTIIPLSTTRFLVVSDGGGSSFTSRLAQTVAPADASIDAPTEAAALQAEATAYISSVTK